MQHVLRERERETERDRQRETERQKERERQRERERDKCDTLCRIVELFSPTLPSTLYCHFVTNM